jgi:hypothetical protein
MNVMSCLGFHDAAAVPAEEPDDGAVGAVEFVDNECVELADDGVEAPGLDDVVLLDPELHPAALIVSTTPKARMLPAVRLDIFQPPISV